jgi:hypothetical protein
LPGAPADTSRCSATGADAYYYNSTTDYTFMLNSSFQGFAAAEQSCKDSGGHLASFESEAEQAEVWLHAHGSVCNSIALHCIRSQHQGDSAGPIIRMHWWRTTGRS